MASFYIPLLSYLGISQIYDRFVKLLYLLACQLQTRDGLFVCIALWRTICSRFGIRIKMQEDDTVDT